MLEQGPLAMDFHHASDMCRCKSWLTWKEVLQYARSHTVATEMISGVPCWFRKSMLEWYVTIMVM